MTSSRPYLIRALYDWIVDNNLTPHLLVDAEIDSVDVPLQHVHDGRIVLNINPVAVDALVLGNHLVEFRARFGGVEQLVRVPPKAVLAIYAKENGQGMAFGDENDGAAPPPTSIGPEKAKRATKKPSLKVVK